MPLVAAACAVRERAHAPYSGFAVGAALRDETGRVHVGCNVENAAYPEGLCAEAGALAAMVAAGGTRVAEIAVVVDAPQPASPCGGCRQKLAEFAGPDLPVIMATLSGVVTRSTLGALLPAAFASSTLPRG